MMKAIVKLFMPGGKTLAGYAADGIAKSVNEAGADVREKVAKYAAFAAKATETANTLAKMVDDGVVSQLERDALQELLAPLFDKMLALV